MGCGNAELVLVRPDRRSELVALQGVPEKRTPSQRTREEWQLRDGWIVPASEGGTGSLHMVSESWYFGKSQEDTNTESVKSQAPKQGLDQYSATDSLS